MLDASGLQTGTSQNFVPFLDLCLHPGGGGTHRIPFHPNRTRPGFLETRIEKLHSHSVAQLCQELAAVIYEPLEMHINRKLMTFLNHFNLSLKRTATKLGRKR